MFFFACLFLVFLSANAALSDLKIIPTQIGSSTINVTKEVFPVPKGCLACLDGMAFLNLHENENTSVVAVRAFLLSNGGELVKFAKGSTRTVSFTLNNVKYTFDPNRMFTPEGIESTLKTYGPYSAEAALEVEKFANSVLGIYDFEHQSAVLALHNNAGTYGANSYLPGQVYQNDAEKVFIAEGTNPSDFFYVVDPVIFDSLSAQGFNTVLQDNSTVTNDGSLSYFAGLKNKQYINFESLAEFTSFGQQVVIQLDMVHAVKNTLQNVGMRKH